MQKNKAGKQNRRMLITVSSIIALAVFGLVVIQADPAGADRLGTLPSDGQTATTAANTAASAPDNAENAGIAKTGTNTSTDSVLPDSDVLGALLKMLSALVIVIALVYLGLHLLRRTMGKRYAGGSQDALEVLQTTYVGQHKAISLVRIADRSVLVGVTDNQISPITELSAEETAQIRESVESGGETATDSFARLLSTAGEKLKAAAFRGRQLKPSDTAALEGHG